MTCIESVDDWFMVFVLGAVVGFLLCVLVMLAIEGFKGAMTEQDGVDLDEFDFGDFEDDL